MKSTRKKILFLQMPWSPIDTPSLALGILKQICEEESVLSRVFYPNLDMYAVLGHSLIDCLSYHNFVGLSEHFFAADLFGKEKINSNDNLKLLIKTFNKNNQIDPKNKEILDYKFLKNIRDNIIPKFLEDVLNRISKFSPTIIGFSATYNQIMSSLALAKRIKQINPNIKIIVGGANFHDYMGIEYHRLFSDIIDHVFIGEGEEPFRKFLHNIKNGKQIQGIPGITTNINGKIYDTPISVLKNLNESPTPNFDDYFLELDRFQKDYGKKILNTFIPFESSRGCWWGEKSHCVFCGNNKNLMKHREKDTDIVIRDLITLTHKYKNNYLRANDSIYPKNNFNDILNHLKDLDYDLSIFYEVKSDLKKWQIILMKEAGLNHVQAGIESLSTPFLKYLRKGTTAIRNIQFMRWCKESKIKLDYNLLGSFPGDEVNWYIDMANLFYRICHLQPPDGHVDFIEMHRFSPFQEFKDEFMVDWYEVRPDISLNYPNDIKASKFCYNLWYSSNKITPHEKYLVTIKNAIDYWRERYNQNSSYTYRIAPGFLKIIDNRSEDGRIFHLSEIYQDIILLCDEVQSYKKLIQDLSSIYPDEAANGTIESAIYELVQEDILISEGNKILTLPISYKNRTTEELREYVLN